MSNVAVTAIVMGCYLVIMLAIGLFYYSKNESLSDYVLGGRNLGVWVSSMSAQASDMSGWLLMGLPGLAYVSAAGTFEAAWTAIGLATGTYLNWLIIAKRLRIYTQETNDSITLPDYFTNRFKDNTNILRIVAALFIIIFFVVYTASGFSAGAKLFGTILGVDYTVALFISGLIIVGYTFLGGFMAVCWTDLVQGILMFFALLIVPGLALGKIGSLNAAVEQVAQIRPGGFNIFAGGSVVLLISGLAWGLGYFGQPHILSRFMAIRNPKEIKTARRISITWVIVTLFCAIFIGMIGIVFFQANPLADRERIFIEMVGQLAPPIIAGVLYTAILAAIMSTADSQLLVTSSAVAEDLYKAYFRKKASDKELVWVSRITVIVVTVIAIFLASNPDSLVFGLVSYAWAGFGATFGPIVLISLFWKRINKYGAIAGMVSGGCTVIIWNLIRSAVNGAVEAGSQSASMLAAQNVFGVYELLPAFGIAVILIFVVSLATKAPDDEITSTFERVKKLAKER